MNLSYLFGFFNPKQRCGIFAQDLLLGGFTDVELQDCMNILLDIDDPRPIRTKDNLIGIPLQFGEVLEEVLGREPRYVHINIPV